MRTPKPNSVVTIGMELATQCWNQSAHSRIEPGDSRWTYSHSENSCTNLRKKHMNPIDHCANSSPRAAISLVLTLIVIGSFAACRPRNNSVPDIPIVESPNPPASYADVAARALPAVVTVRSERVVRAPEQYPFYNDPFFRYFFGAPPSRGPSERREFGLGSGVIVSADGYIVTNHHVIDGAEDIKVVLSNNSQCSAQVIGSDPASDLAVLKIDKRDLPVLSFGDSDKVRVGDIALAIGSPLGLPQTVTAGIISAKGRRTGVSDGSFEDFLQTDAPINQGNSGGALINSNAVLIGINSQILSQNGGNVGIGFAIPSNMAHGVMQQLIAHGNVRRGRLGIAIQELTDEAARQLGLPDVRGVVVAGVEKDSPADRAGIRERDVITAFNGNPIEDGNSLRNQVAATEPGTEITLTLVRDGHEQQVRVNLGEFTPAPQNGS
jgi:Do/DeqQ family serine protease